MHRLLQGEVGSGKTLCALRAMLQVVDAGGQAAMLAPTEVLAAQHYRNVGRAARAAGPRRRTRTPPPAPPGSPWSPVRSARRRGARRWPRWVRRGRHRGRHPRAALRGRRLRRPRPDRGRRAAPVRRGAARRAAGEGRPAAARTGDDRDADPAYRRHDGVRRPGDLHAVASCRAAGRRSPRTSSRRRRSRRSWTGPGARLREEVGRRAPGVRGVPADRWTSRRATPSAAEPPPTRTATDGHLLAVVDVAPAAAPRGRCTVCASGYCTAGCRPTRRTR